MSLKFRGNKAVRLSKAAERQRKEDYQELGVGTLRHKRLEGETIGKVQPGI